MAWGGEQSQSKGTSVSADPCLALWSSRGQPLAPALGHLGARAGGLLAVAGLHFLEAWVAAVVRSEKLRLTVSLGRVPLVVYFNPREPMNRGPGDARAPHPPRTPAAWCSREGAAHRVDLCIVRLGTTCTSMPQSGRRPGCPTVPVLVATGRFPIQPPELSGRGMLAPDPPPGAAGPRGWPESHWQVLRSHALWPDLLHACHLRLGILSGDPSMFPGCLPPEPLPTPLLVTRASSPGTSCVPQKPYCSHS